MELWPIFLIIFIIGLLLMGWIKGQIDYGRATAWERERRDVLLRDSLSRGKGRR